MVMFGIRKTNVGAIYFLANIPRPRMNWLAFLVWPGETKTPEPCHHVAMLVCPYFPCLSCHAGRTTQALWSAKQRGEIPLNRGWFRGLVQGALRNQAFWLVGKRQTGSRWNALRGFSYLGMRLLLPRSDQSISGLLSE